MTEITEDDFFIDDTDDMVDEGKIVIRLHSNGLSFASNSMMKQILDGQKALEELPKLKDIIDKSNKVIFSQDEEIKSYRLSSEQEQESYYILEQENQKLKAENEELRQIKINLQGNGEQIIQDIMDELNRRMKLLKRHESEAFEFTNLHHQIGSDFLNFVRDTLNRELFGVGKNTVMGGNHDYTNIKKLQQESKQAIEILKRLEEFVKKKYGDYVNNPEHTPEWKLLEEISEILKGDST